jgi:KDO2-lipid IV(A) lauroyltransferase
VAKRTALRNAVEYGAAFLVVGLLAVLPRAAAEILGRGCARLLDRAVPRLRRVGMRNLEFAMPAMKPAERARLIDGVFRSIGRLLVAFAKLPGIGKENVHDWIRYEGFEHFEEARRRGRGVLFATAHLGNWELSAFAHALLSRPMYVMVRPLDNPLIDRLVEARRTLSGNRLVQKKEFLRAILKALKDNEAAGVLIDQNASLDEGIFVDLFGVPACCGTGFAKLAAHSGAAIIPGYALWSESEKKYILRFYQPLYATGDAAEDTRLLHRHLEGVIREYPDQWLWIHRRWKTRPPGSPPLYD